MSKVHYVPEGYSTITPYLIIKGAAKAIEYYKTVFGAKELMRLDAPGGRIGHAELEIGSSKIMLADENLEMGHRSAETMGGSPISLHAYFPDCDAVIEKAAANGAKIVRPAADQFYGDRSGIFLDPFGHQWSVATHTEDVSAEDMAERARKAMPAA